ncbi:hypothetical protein [Kytococcus sp. Marseille-QA3725]
MREDLSRTVWDRVVTDPDAGTEQLDPAATEALPRNGTRILGATSLLNTADQLIHAPTVLTWALTGLGAPGWTVGLLVPVRESGSMLPQSALTPWVRSTRRRNRLVALGALVQAAGAAGLFTGVAALWSRIEEPAQEPDADHTPPQPWTLLRTAPDWPPSCWAPAWPRCWAAA